MSKKDHTSDVPVSVSVEKSASPASHMLGPWHVDGQFDSEVSVEIRSADDLLVCEIEPFLDDWADYEVANVHLMAAAPELLRQLKALVVQIEHSHMIVPPNVSAVIAKAEGR